MPSSLSRLTPFLLFAAVLAVPHAPYGGRTALTSQSGCSGLPTTVFSTVTVTSSVHSSSSTPSTSSATMPTSTSPAASKSGCVWTIPGVGSFAHASTWTFANDSSLPPGLQVNTYIVDSVPLSHEFTASNAYVANGFLNLRVPGGQTRSPVKGGEVQTTVGDILHGSVRVRAMLSTVPGTCVGNFFYKNDNQEVDIEYLSDPSSLSNDGPTPLMQYTNQALVAGEAATHDTAPAPANVTALHEYRIDWTAHYTAFYLDGVLQKTLAQNVPTKGSAFLLNNWSTGDEGWTVGPPWHDNIYRIKDIVMYYNRTGTNGAC